MQQNIYYCISWDRYAIVKLRWVETNRRYWPLTSIVAVNRLSPKLLNALTVYLPPSEDSTLFITSEFLPPSPAIVFILSAICKAAPSFNLWQRKKPKNISSYRYQPFSPLGYSCIEDVHWQRTSPLVSIRQFLCIIVCLMRDTFSRNGPTSVFDVQIFRSCKM